MKYKTPLMTHLFLAAALIFYIIGMAVDDEAMIIISTISFVVTMYGNEILKSIHENKDK